MSFDRAAGKTGNVPVGDARQCPTALRDRPPALSQHQSHCGRSGAAVPHCPHSLLDALLHGQSRRHLKHTRPQGVKTISLTTWPRTPNGPWSFPLSITRTPPALPSVSASRSWAFHRTRSPGFNSTSWGPTWSVCTFTQHRSTASTSRTSFFRSSGATPSSGSALEKLRSTSSWPDEGRDAGSFTGSAGSAGGGVGAGTCPEAAGVGAGSDRRSEQAPAPPARTDKRGS